MLLKFNKYSYLIIAICFIVVAAVIENGLLKKHPETHLVENFETELINNEKVLITHLNNILEVIKSTDNENISEAINESGLHLSEPGFGYLVFQNGELVYWSNRSVAFFNTTDEIEDTHGLVLLPNGYYLADKVVKNEFVILGLHLLKSNYNFENKYLRNVFFEGYDLPDEFEISETKTDESKDFQVKNINGEFLFTLVPNGQFLCTKDQLYFPGIIYFLGLLILLFYFRKEFTESKAPFILKLLALATALFIVYWLHLIFNIPRLFFFLRVFSPDYFAINNWLPSLGDFFLLTLFFLFWVYNFGVSLNIKQLHENSKLPRKIVAVLLLLFSASLYLLANYFIEQLILNSTISFSLNKIIEITVQSAFAIFSVGLILFSILYFTTRITEEARHDFSFLQLLGVIVSIALFFGVVQFIAIGKISISVLILFVFAAIFGCILSRKYLQNFTLSYLIVFVSIASVYSLAVFYSTISVKERGVQKLLALNLVTERDPAAEEFLTNIQYQLSNDAAIYSLLLQEEDIEEYIEKVYFNGYFRKYLIKVYVCEKTDSLFYEPEGRNVSCMPFMDELISSQGDRIPGTDFYFMDNMNGRISYTGKISFPFFQNSGGVTIYIDLDSDLLFDGIGFPELLIDKSIARSENYKKFDYAKYYGGELTDKFGDYDYNFHI
ncbi:MAG: hypothetical protein L3J54_02400, partial [Draconibacterium sp.]|nr:hypothetical protein [Draconibacterium sp.]